MDRSHYRLFTETRIGPMTVPNRLVRSATWDPSILRPRKMNRQVLNLYRTIAAGGAGMIITGDLVVVPEGMLEHGAGATASPSYRQVRIDGYARLPEVVHQVAPGCKIIAQHSADYPGVAPSAMYGPFSADLPRALACDEISSIVACFVEAVDGARRDGFDGVQLHAAHGSVLSRFLSPYSNQRSDAYGGSPQNRARIVREIVAGARARVGSFPILIKMNGTDHLPGGIDLGNFPQLAQAVAASGVDAIEISGGMWDSLIRNEEELGFRPVPAAESHTRLSAPEHQSYYLPYAEALDLDIPVILAGGNRDVERLEGIVRQGTVQLVSMCRPFLREPGLPRRWRDGRGTSGTLCVSCNSCIYDMWTHVGQGEPWVARCLVQDEPAQVPMAQAWLSEWVQKNRVSRPGGGQP